VILTNINSPLCMYVCAYFTGVCGKAANLRMPSRIGIHTLANMSCQMQPACTSHERGHRAQTGTPRLYEDTGRPRPSHATTRQPAMSSAAGAGARVGEPAARLAAGCAPYRWAKG
jgi:hypothetical protein